MPESLKTFFKDHNIPVALFWIVELLIAGFIAQFGKIFANFITNRIKRIRGKDSADIEAVKDIIDASSLKREKELVKIEKKAEKARVKQLKKKGK
jgi:hypothetical protein